MSVSRETVQFGKSSAEFERKELEHYFVENRAYERLHSGPRRILIGNRGSGKSAVFNMLAKRDGVAGNIAISLAPENYSYDMLRQISEGNPKSKYARATAYMGAWKFLMLSLALRQIAKIDKDKQRLGKQEKSLNKFVDANRRQSGERPLEVLVNYLQRIEDANLHSSNSQQRASELGRLYDGAEVGDLIPLISKIPGGKSVHIYVDELDLGWDGSEEAQAFVAGLWQACIALNKVDTKLRVYIALRHELLSTVPALTVDAEKYRDMFEHIHWDADSLYTLITRRIAHYFPGAEATDTQNDVWRRAFTDLSSYRYMLERSLYRPRELIVYCTEALEYARQNGRAIPMAHRTVEAVEARVSQDRINDVAEEYRFQYEGLNVVMKAFAQGPARYDRDRLLEKLLELSCGESVPAAKLPPWVFEADPSELLEVLWKVGFISIETPARERQVGGSRPGSPEDSSVDLDTASGFVILPMYHKALRVGDI